MSAPKKQTAVEWLIDKLTSQPIENINDEYWFGIIEQAKAMEREQIMDAYIEASPRLSDIITESAEQYYNETYETI